MAKKTTKNNFDIKQLLDNSGSYKNLIYGAVTVLILAVIVFLGMRTLSQNEGDINDAAVTVTEEENASEYTVVEGDTLWSISEKLYGTGFNWQMIADNNELSDPNNIPAGTKLKVPSITPTISESETEESEEEIEKVSPTASATAAVTQTPTKTEVEKPTSTAKEYTVAKGDTLWSISVAQYGNGYKWSEIAKANKLVNPNIIHTGNRLVLPR